MTPPADVYVCLTTGETESRTMGGFDVCCDRPDCPGNAEGPATVTPLPARFDACPACGVRVLMIYRTESDPDGRPALHDCTQAQGDGRPECPTCGKYVWPVSHSCSGVRQTAAEGPATVTLTAKWRDASEAARKSQHHFPADCLAEAALVVEALTDELAAARADADEWHQAYMIETDLRVDQVREREQVIANVRALHVQGLDEWSMPACTHCLVLWPCPTVALLPAAPTEGKTT